uniref:Vang-like protein n=1 Tax=Meloidogyne hapla TaxID=6305 RepID=A0A1I8BTC6_MELHA
MSKISERPFSSSHRPMNRAFRHQPPIKSNRSVIGCGGNVDRQFLLPHFSAAMSEGVQNPIDERWVDENTTVVTGATSEHSFNDNIESLPHFPPPPGNSIFRLLWRRFSWICWLFSTFSISFMALISAPLMIALPFAIERIGLVEEIIHLNNIGCEIECQVLLFLALYVLFWRRSTADLPRLHLNRAAFALFVFFVLFAFWLFYTARILLERNIQLIYLISFAISLLDILLFIHCIWIFFELRQIRPVYCIQFVRDPDGEWRSHEIGQMSIQEAAVQVLLLYRVHFPVYNSVLEHTRRSNTFGGRFRSAVGRPGFKLYDIDGQGDQTTALSEMNARILMQAASQRRMAAHNELFHEECDWERRFKKRKCRLISCTEEIFAQVQSSEFENENKMGTVGSQIVEPMDPQIAAKAVLSSIAKQLNRFLRYTRQERFHTQSAVFTHVQRCLAFGFSARTFLQRFFSNAMPFQEDLPESKWSLICGNNRASNSIHHGLTFVLRCHNNEGFDRGVQLLCSVSALPFVNLTEQTSPLNSFRLKIVTGNPSAVELGGV